MASSRNSTPLEIKYCTKLVPLHFTVFSKLTDLTILHCYEIIHLYLSLPHSLSHSFSPFSLTTFLPVPVWHINHTFERRFVFGVFLQPIRKWVSFTIKAEMATLIVFRICTLLLSWLVMAFWISSGKNDCTVTVEYCTRLWKKSCVWWSCWLTHASNCEGCHISFICKWQRSKKT